MISKRDAVAAYTALIEWWEELVRWEYSEDGDGIDEPEPPAGIVDDIKTVNEYLSDNGVSVENEVQFTAVSFREGNHLVHKMFYDYDDAYKFAWEKAGKPYAIDYGECVACGRQYDDLADTEEGVCPAEDCPSNNKHHKLYNHEETRNERTFRS